MVKAKDVVVLSMASLFVFIVDQATKSFSPTLYTTNRIPIGLSVLAISVGIYLLTKMRNFSERLLISLFLGAAAGNIVDRLRFGVVRDIYAIGDMVINVADIGIVVSVAAFIVLMAKDRWYKAKS